MKKFIAVMLMVIAGAAQAQWSVTGGVGQTRYSAFTVTPYGQAQGYTADSSATSWSITGKYQFAPTWGAEAGYRSFGTEHSSGPSFSASAKGTAWTYGLAYNRPLMAGVDLIGRAGGYNGRADINSPSLNASYTSTKAYFGVGAMWKLDAPFSVGLNWTRFVSPGSTNADAVEAVVKYHF